MKRIANISDWGDVFADNMDRELKDLHESGGELVDIKYSTDITAPYSKGDVLYSALIIYDDGKE